MRVVGLPRAFYHIVRHPVLDLSPKAPRLAPTGRGLSGRLLSCWQALRQQGLSSQKASQVLVFPRSTLYRWQKRLREKGPQGLEEKSRRPRHKRQPTWSPHLAQAVLRLREQFPRWGKSLP